MEGVSWKDESQEVVKPMAFAWLKMKWNRGDRRCVFQESGSEKVSRPTTIA